MNQHHNRRSTSHRSPYQIVGLGEVLWDVFPDGAKFGGAPANFACSTAGISPGNSSVFMVSSVGNDALGERALAALREKSVETAYVARQDRPTGTVHVQLDAQGQASYIFAADPAWDHLEWLPDLQQLAARTDAVCFGTLGQRGEVSRATIRSFLQATGPACLRVFDVNLRPPFFNSETLLTSLALANVLKLNEDELPELARLCELSGSDIHVVQQLAARFDLLAVALTRGSDGAVLIRGEEISDLPGIETTVVDTVGAGDAYTAAFVLGLLGGEPLDTINRHASAVAAFVCSQAGATPVMPPAMQKVDADQNTSN